MDSNSSNNKDVKSLKAAALRYDAANDRAPYVVAAGSGYMAQRILQTAIENGVAIYHDDSAATMLTKLQTGREIPPDLYQIVVNIYLALLDVADFKFRGGAEKVIPDSVASEIQTILDQVTAKQPEDVQAT